MQTINQIKKKDPNTISILWMSDDFNWNSGYAKCCREILTRLAKPDPNSKYKFEVNHIAKFAKGEAYRVHGLNFGVHPFTGQNGEILLPVQLKALQCDVFVCQDDSFVMTRNQLHEIDYNATNTKFLPYVAFDGEPLPTGSQPPLEKAHSIIAMTKYGKRIMKKEFGYNNIDVIYHGVDIRKYLPTNNKEQLRQQISQFYSEIRNVKIDMTNKFIMFACGRNSVRKNFCQLLDFFAEFQEGKDDVCLLLHANNFHKSDLDLIDYIERVLPFKFGDKAKDLLWKKIVLTPSQDLSRGMPETELIKIMQLSNAHLSCSTGEGFGMVILESMACGTPVISNGFTTPTELLIDEVTIDGKKI